MTDQPNVPFVDLLSQHREVEDHVREAMADILERTAYIGGSAVSDFEAAFAAFCNTKFCVGAANGTDAIEMILRGLDIGVGHEVIIPTNTFIATAEAVARCGADVVVVDCDLDYGLIDTDQALAAITPKTKAIIGVDLYGQIAPFDQLQAATDRGVYLIEDAAQSQGATRNGQPIGTSVVAASSSFYPGKNLGAYGDAGALVTNDEALEQKSRAIGSHGGLVRYAHDYVGMNSRLDALQAVVLSAKLRRLNDWNASRRAAADRYTDMLSAYPEIITPQVAPGNEHIWHLYTVLVDNRDRVIDTINSAGIGAAIHYPVPVHLTGAFEHLGVAAGTHPIAERRSNQMISLPMFPHITEAQQARVVEELVKATR